MKQFPRLELIWNCRRSSDNSDFVLIVYLIYLNQNFNKPLWKIWKTWIRVVTGPADRPVRSGPVEDSLPAGIPAGRTNFFFTGPVWIFFEFFPIFFRKNNQKGVFFENQKLFTNVEDYFGKKNCIKLSYWVKICHGCFYIYPIHVGTTFSPYSSTNDILSFKIVFIGQN